jgi:hypothetical protein
MPARLAVYRLNHAPALFALLIFGNKVLLFVQVGLDHRLPIFRLLLSLRYQVYTTIPRLFSLGCSLLLGQIKSKCRKKDQIACITHFIILFSALKRPIAKDKPSV